MPLKHENKEKNGKMPWRIFIVQKVSIEGVRNK